MYIDSLPLSYVEKHNQYRAKMRCLWINTLVNHVKFYLKILHANCTDSGMPSYQGGHDFC